MGLIYIPEKKIRRNFKPDYPVELNKDSPFCSALLGCIATNSPVNLVTGVPLTAVGARITEQITSHGRGFLFSRNWYLQTETLPAIGTNPYTIFWAGVTGANYSALSNNFGALVGDSVNQMALAQGPYGGGVGNLCGVSNWTTTPSITYAIPANTYTVLALVRTASSFIFYRDGVQIGTVAITPYSQPASEMIVGSFIASTSYWAVENTTIMAGRVARGWSAAEAQSFTLNPYQLLRPKQRTLIFPLSSGSGITGSLATTDGADVMSATVLVAISGQMATTDGADVFSASVSVQVNATMGVTDGADIMSASGTVASAINGTMATTDGADIFSGSAAVQIQATMIVTDGADIFAALGNNGQPGLTMPNLVGMILQEAIVTLINANIVPNEGLVPTNQNPPPTVGYFNPWPVKVIRVKGAPQGLVVQQSPVAGSTVDVTATWGPGFTYTAPITLTVNAPTMAVVDQFTAGAYGT